MRRKKKLRKKKQRHKEEHKVNQSMLKQLKIILLKKEEI